MQHFVWRLFIVLPTQTEHEISMGLLSASRTLKEHPPFFCKFSVCLDYCTGFQAFCFVLKALDSEILTPNPPSPIMHFAKQIAYLCNRCKSISSSGGAQYVTSKKKKLFFTSKFNYVADCFATPPMKLKMGQHTGQRLLIANHLDQSLWWTNQKHSAAVRSYLSHSFLQVHGCAFCHPLQIVQLCWAKTIFLSQSRMFWLSFIQFYSADHILSTTADLDVYSNLAVMAIITSFPWLGPLHLVAPSGPFPSRCTLRSKQILTSSSPSTWAIIEPEIIEPIVHD